MPKVGHRIMVLETTIVGLQGRPIDHAWFHNQDDRRKIITSWTNVENVGPILHKYCGSHVDIVQTNVFLHGVV